ncbi:hypothetical protein [Bacillus wiedmannii]|uniref:hypothetical protein n=1 Tax=Bacillus wiedmannii TaxID=1890302 RepID=UPI003D1F6990
MDTVNPYFDDEKDDNFDVAGNSQHLNQELVALYASLETLIKKCNFNERQMMLIDLVSRGYSFADIGRMETGVDESSARKMLNTIYKSIAKENELEWKKYINHTILKAVTKKCRMCEEELPVTDSFFAKDKKSKDGFKHDCKKCKKVRQKTA